MNRRLFHRALALLSTGTVAAAAVVAFSATPALAADLGTITLSQTTGSVTASPMFTSATTSAACPTGFGQEAALRIGRPGGPYTNLAAIQGGNIFDTAPFSISPNRSFQQSVGSAPGTGAWQVVIECFSLESGRHPDRFVANIRVIAGGVWELAVVNATTTTLTVSDTTINLGDSVTLTAAVGPAGAAGTVQFQRGAANTPVGSPVAVSAGSASVTTNALPAGTYNLTAAFTPTDPTAFAPSVSAPTSITVAGPAGGEVELVELSADVAPGAFSLNVAANSAILAGGTVGGSATGTLPQATVVDLRGTNAGWNVTGQVEDFVHGTDATKTIPGARLGWTPAALKVSGSGAVAAGPAVSPGATPGGLADGVTLCSAANNSSAGTFNCNAGLILNIPDTTLPGPYSATLTLTLI